MGKQKQPIDVESSERDNDSGWLCTDSADCLKNKKSSQTILDTLTHKGSIKLTLVSSPSMFL